MTTVRINQQREQTDIAIRRTKARVAGRKAAADLVGLLDLPEGHGADFADIPRLSEAPIYLTHH